MKKQVINLIFVSGFFVFLVLNFLKTICLPTDINTYENRKAVSLEKPTLGAFLRGSLQQNMKDSIADQAFFAQKIKKAYNLTVSEYLKKVLPAVSDKENPKYIKIGDYYLYGDDYILYEPYVFESCRSKLDGRCEYFNAMYEKYPGLDFYFYYIEKEIDMNFETGEKIQIFDHMAENTLIPESNKSAFRINNFEEYANYFYKTDHHWNAKGSYRAYKQLVNMIIPGDDKFVTRSDEIKITDEFGGSKTTSDGTATYREPFMAYKYDYPPMSISINGAAAADYGCQDEYLSGTGKTVTYGDFYGWDIGEIILDTGNSEKENILIIGESYDNAVLKLIASHFNRTVSVDMRNYKAQMGKDFSFKECIEKNNIDKVLYIGSIGFYTDTIFEPEG